MKKELLIIIEKDPDCTFQIKYVDSEGYTVPLWLCESRLDSFCDDASLESVKINFSNGGELTLMA